MCTQKTETGEIGERGGGHSRRQYITILWKPKSSESSPGVVANVPNCDIVVSKSSHTITFRLIPWENKWKLLIPPSYQLDSTATRAEFMA